jgi:hypothetical protein
MAFSALSPEGGNRRGIAVIDYPQR